MKNIIIGLFAMISLSTFAHTIEGTLILKGTLKTKIIVETLDTTCRLKIEKVKNLLAEDSFGNPAYLVKASISLDASDYERNLKINFKQTVMFDNLFQVGEGTEVKDLDYKSNDGSQTMKIERSGRVKAVTFSYNGQKTTCSF